jgi:tetratricopeptide (TPR) repeat protein
MNTAQIILLLISSDFMASDYCYTVEVQQALERHRKKEAIVVPILLRPVDWQDAPFGGLMPLPSNKKPITSWAGRHGRDQALYNITLGLKEIVKSLQVQKQGMISKGANLEFDTTAAGRIHESETALALQEAIALLHLSKAENLYKNTRFVEALSIYEQAILLNPNNPAAHLGKGDTLFALGRFHEALFEYKQAIQYDTEDIDAYIGKGNSLYMLHRNDEALDAFERAKYLDINNAVVYYCKGKRSL